MSTLPEMIRLQPFRAVTPPEGSLSREAASDDSEVTADSETINGMLARWRAAGLLTTSERPALHLLETRVVGPQRSLIPEPPVRFLLGRLTRDAQLAPLEEAARSALVPEIDPVLSLVADPEGAFRGLLDEIATRAEHVAEARANGHLIRLSRITQSGTLKKVQTLLGQARVRTLTVPAESENQLAAFVSLAEPGLHLRPIHRGVRNWPTWNEELFLQLVGGYARVFPLPMTLNSPRGLDDALERLASLSNGHHAILAVLPDSRGAILRVRQGIDLGHLPAAPRSPTLRSLDLALLESLVLRTVLGIKEPEAVAHPNVVPVHSIEELIDQVDSGVLQVGFALNPPPVWEVRAVMEAAATLPPATLSVDPVVPRGFVIVDGG